MPLTIRRRVQSIVALMPSVLTTVLLSILGLWLVRRYADPEVLRASNDIVGNYLQTLGTVYAVLLAFVVYVVWGQFNDARAQVEREANELMDLYRTTEGLPEAARARMHADLRRYVDEVIEHEWKAMAKGDEACIDRVGRILDEIWGELKCFEPESGCHGALYDEALGRFNDLADLRTMRLTSARLHIPFAMRLLLYFGAVIVIGSMWLFYLESFAMHALITGAMAGALSHVLYLIGDLDNCFAGDWRVSREPFRRAKRYMAECA
jgi:Protein of unknown function (DUF4239)